MLIAKGVLFWGMMQMSNVRTSSWWNLDGSGHAEGNRAIVSHYAEVPHQTPIRMRQLGNNQPFPVKLDGVWFNTFVAFFG